MNPESIQKRIKTDPYNPCLYLELSQAYLETGEDARAREIVLRRRNMPSDNPVIHRDWGEICEELGMALQAQESYERALRLAPGDSETLYLLAVLLAEIGHYEKSLHYLKKAIKHNPDHHEARDLLAENYRALGLEGLAEALRPKTKKPSSSSPPRYFPPRISEKHTARFLGLFGGREVGYAVQYVDQATGQLSYLFKEAPLTHELIASHLLGNITIAGYPLRSDNTVRYATVSVRIPRGVLKNNLKDSGYLAYLEENTRHHVLLLEQYAETLQMAAYPEDSGAREYRLWFFFREPTHFLKIKRFITAFLEEAPRPGGNLTVEAILATKPVGLGWVERPVVLPFSIERSTLRRSVFLDHDGRPHVDQLKFLKKIREISSEAIRRSFRKGEARPPGHLLKAREMPVPASLLADRCAVVRELIQKALSGKVLRREEKVILFYTVALADRDGDSLHRVLEACPDYDYEKVQRQAARLQANPISCLKIREMVPELTSSVACNCTFDLRGGKYPSPVLHVNPHLVPATEEFAVPDSLPVREAARRYVNLRRHSEEINRALMRLEAILDKGFSRKGIEAIRVGKVGLRRAEEEGHVRWQMEVG